MHLPRKHCSTCRMYQCRSAATIMHARCLGGGAHSYLAARHGHDIAFSSTAAGRQVAIIQRLEPKFRVDTQRNVGNKAASAHQQLPCIHLAASLLTTGSVTMPLKPPHGAASQQLPASYIQPGCSSRGTAASRSGMRCTPRCTRHQQPWPGGCQGANWLLGLGRLHSSPYAHMWCCCFGGTHQATTNGHQGFSQRPLEAFRKGLSGFRGMKVASRAAPSAAHFVEGSCLLVACCCCS